MVSFRSTRDARFVVPRAAAAAVMLTAGVAVIAFAREPGVPLVLPLVTGILIVIAGAVHLAATLVVRYRIDDFELIVHHGLWRTRVPLECIEGVLPVRPTADEFHARPAHVTVVYQRSGRSKVAILTPEDPEAFLGELARAAPFLERTGDRLLRKPGLMAVR